MLHIILVISYAVMQRTTFVSEFINKKGCIFINETIFKLKRHKEYLERLTQKKNN